MTNLLQEQTKQQTLLEEIEASLKVNQKQNKELSYLKETSTSSKEEIEQLKKDINKIQSDIKNIESKIGSM